MRKEVFEMLLGAAFGIIVGVLLILVIAGFFYLTWNYGIVSLTSAGKMEYGVACLVVFLLFVVVGFFQKGKR